MIDWYQVGLVISLVLAAILILLFVLWVACRSYELGWHDCEKDEWIGDNSKPPLFRG